jgi:hypothetical protein
MQPWDQEATTTLAESLVFMCGINDEGDSTLTIYWGLPIAAADKLNTGSRHPPI